MQFGSRSGLFIFAGIYARILVLSWMTGLLFGQAERTVQAPKKLPAGSPLIKHVVFILKENRSSIIISGRFRGRTAPPVGRFRPGR
jgi:hypothetical protein